MSGQQHRAFWMSPAYYWSMAALLGLGIVLATQLRWITDAQVQDLKLEIVKLALQLMVVGIIGGLVKLALDERKELAEFRSEVIAELGKAHAQVYRLRRMLALRGRDPEVVRECVFELMNVRNELGSVGHHVRSKQDAKHDTVVANIAVIRIYFEELIDESMSGAGEGNMSIGAKLGLFIVGCQGNASETDVYQRRFKAPYLRAKSAADPTWVLTKENLATMALKVEPDSSLAPAPTTPSTAKPE